VNIPMPVEADLQRIIANARTLRANVEQILTDCAWWNENARRPTEAPIDPDPDGELHRMRDRLDVWLAFVAKRPRCLECDNPATFTCVDDGGVAAHFCEFHEADHRKAAICGGAMSRLQLPRLRRSHNLWR
jgi:hypothetical protein